MSFIKYTREELLKIIPMLLNSDLFLRVSQEDKNYNKNLFYYCNKKREDLLYLKIDCEDHRIDEEELNRTMWKILGSGSELYLFISVPLERIPLLINDYKGTPLHTMIKIRLEIGK